MKIITTFFILIFLSSPLLAGDLLYTDTQADCAAKMIFLNECSSKEKNLLYWSENEAFPSLGIGHFIWYSRQANGFFRESFPGFLEFARELGLAVPAWVTDLPDGRAPWRSREEFQQDLNSPRMKELRAFLAQTKREQAHYILRRFQKVFPTILDDVDERDQPIVQEKYDLLMTKHQWAFAMVDYVNFKGEGYRTDGRYEGSGWGLAQVLLEMKIPDDSNQALDEFIAAAERVLEDRVSRSPRPDVESKWLVGWKNRVRSYRDINC